MKAEGLNFLEVSSEKPFLAEIVRDMFLTKEGHKVSVTAVPDYKYIVRVATYEDVDLLPVFLANFSSAMAAMISKPRQTGKPGYIQDNPEKLKLSSPTVPYETLSLRDGKIYGSSFLWASGVDTVLPPGRLDICTSLQHLGTVLRATHERSREYEPVPPVYMQMIADDLKAKVSLFRLSIPKRHMFKRKYLAAFLRDVGEYHGTLNETYRNAHAVRVIFNHTFKMVWECPEINSMSTTFDKGKCIGPRGPFALPTLHRDHFPYLNTLCLRVTGSNPDFH